MFAIPLEDGRFGAARVIGGDRSSVVVIASGYVGKRVPTLEQAIAAPPICEPAHTASGKNGKPTAVTRNVSQPAPAKSVRLGSHPPSAREKRLVCHSYSGWENVSSTILIQWLRANEPRKAEALLAHWRAERDQLDKEYREKEKARKGALTLEVLAKQRLLPRWQGRFQSAVLSQARAILRALVKGLIDLRAETPNPTNAQRLRLVRTAVEGFNALDNVGDLRIHTTEREDICEAINDILEASGWRPRTDPTEKWRDW